MKVMHTDLVPGGALEFWLAQLYVIVFRASCSLTPAVSKASAGAMEGLPLYSTNVRQLLKVRKRNL